MQIFDFVGIASASLAFFVALYFAVSNSRNKSKRLYDMERQKAEFQEMRKHFENMIYEQTHRLSRDPKRWRDINHLVVDGSFDIDDHERKLGRHTSQRNFLESLGLSSDFVRVIPGTAFVLTPFNPGFDKHYTSISNVCEKIGLKVGRGDEEHISTPILPYIVKRIISASVVIANIDGRNPNVFYELGVAHALNKDVILLSSSIDSVPFDLRSQRIVLWKNEADLYRGLSSAITRLFVHRDT